MVCDLLVEFSEVSVNNFGGQQISGDLGLKATLFYDADENVSFLLVGTDDFDDGAKGIFDVICENAHVNRQAMHITDVDIVGLGEGVLETREIFKQSFFELAFVVISKHDPNSGVINKSSGVIDRCEYEVFDCFCKYILLLF